MNTIRPGDSLRGRLKKVAPALNPTTSPNPASESKPTLNPLKNLSALIPENLVDPFRANNVIAIVFLALLSGAALRRVQERQQISGHDSQGITAILSAVRSLFAAMLEMLHWVLQAVPLAVFGVMAQAVGRSGLASIASLGPFLAVVLSGLAIHALIYYPSIAWLVAGKSPRVFIGKGADAILTGLSANSSLAATPLTLRCLTDKMGVSEASARLAACVGTNLNNDGITLYEAMAALFLAQACGIDLNVGQQIAVVFAALMTGIGVAGVPEAGLIVLPLVLGAAGLPEPLVLTAVPLLLPVDWLVARARSGVNVMSDLLVGILLDHSWIR
jgi:Na+/H+-dicarboxylate symporter